METGCGKALLTEIARPTAYPKWANHFVSLFKRFNFLSDIFHITQKLMPYGVSFLELKVSPIDMQIGATNRAFGNSYNSISRLLDFWIGTFSTLTSFTPWFTAAFICLPSFSN
jgi:hypothetical protein